MNMEQIECSETSAYKIQTPGNYPEESIKQGISSTTEQGLSHFSSKMSILFIKMTGSQKMSKILTLSELPPNPRTAEGLIFNS